MDIQIILLSLFFLFAVFRFMPASKRASTTSATLPPGPAPFPVVGNLLQLGDEVHKSLAALATAYGPLMTVKLGCVTVVVVSSAATAKEVLRDRDLPLSGRPIPDVTRALGHNELSMFLLPVGPLWRNLRKARTNHVFSNKSLDATGHLRRQKVRELVAFARNCSQAGVAIDIGQAALVTSLNLLSNTFFSVDMASLGSERAQEFRDLVQATTEELGKPNVSDYFPLLRKLDLQGTRRRLERNVAKIYRVFDELISERVMSKKVHEDVLNALLGIADENSSDKIIDRHHIIPLLSDLFIAATDTTSVTLEWAMAELLHSSSILSKARKEIQQNIGQDNPIEESDIARLPYLQAIMKETFRLHPAGPLLIPHKAEEDVEIQGYTIPKGTQVLVNAWAIGQDSSFWANPNEFLPERFLELDIDVRGRNFELIPFGAGRRICPGLPLALRMVHLMLASLLQSFDWKLEEGMLAEEMDMNDQVSIVLRKVVPLRTIPVPL